VVRSQHGQIVLKEFILEKIFTKIGLLEWLEVKALSSSPSTYKKKRLQTEGIHFPCPSD
jgi:hypothetical protein